MCFSGISKATQRHRGFTLTELMIVVAIVAILGSIALPAYTDHIRRGQLPEAFATLADYRSKLDQYFFNQKNYGTAGDCASDASASQWNTFPRTQHFTYECALSDDTFGFVLTATGVEGEAAEGHVYTIDQNGTKSTKEFKGSNVTGNTCWFTKSAACD